MIKSSVEGAQVSPSTTVALASFKWTANEQKRARRASSYSSDIRSANPPPSAALRISYGIALKSSDIEHNSSLENCRLLERVVSQVSLERRKVSWMNE